MMKKNIKANEISDIFKVISPTDNDKFLDIKGNDLLDILMFINDYYLTLRHDLGLKKSLTFGLELEFEKTSKFMVSRKLKHLFCDNEWKVIGDSSLCRGAEIVSPILEDTFWCWEELEKVCNVAKRCGTIYKNAGGHIHVGTQILECDKEALINFLKIWSVYENVIIRFTNGEFLTQRQNMYRHAHLLAEDFALMHYDIRKSEYLFESFESVLNYINRGRYRAVNFRNTQPNMDAQVGNTIEFRCPNGTLEPVIWQNNVNLFLKLLLYCKSKKYNDDIVEKRVKSRFYNTDYSNEICLEQALELCDMVFSNNLDKVYFLRQYLKSFEEGIDPLQKAKKFIK